MSGCDMKFCSMSEARVHGWLSGHAYLRRSWIQHQIDKKNGVLLYPPLLSPPHGVNNFHKELAPPSSSSGTRINPAVLIIIIVILAVVFFISGILHVLVRFLTKHPSSPSPSRYPDISNSDVLQRQLQQLFHLHDSGLDQAFIDALPVFKYKKISGLKEPFDCAVCLCEFSEKDKLRLLPVCSHAFHINCIDTWLLSNSTCPLCRGTLFAPGFSIENPIFDYDDTREEDCFACNGENGHTTGQKTIEIESVVEQGVFPVTLGKFRRLNDGASDAGGETSSSTLDARRCYSMGSHQYVVGDTNLMVALSNERKSRDARNATRTEHNGSPSADSEVDEKKISIRTKTDSYSVSKIWLWSKNSQITSSSQT